MPGIDESLQIAHKPWIDHRSFRNGSTTAGIQEAVTALSVTGGTILVSDGTWDIRTTITVPYNNITIIGESLNSILRFANNITNMFRVTGNRFKLSGVTINGNFKASTGAFQIGVWATSINDLTIENNLFYYLGYPTAPDFESTGYGNTHSLLITGSTNIKIIGNKHHTIYGVDVQITTGCTAILIDRNVMGTAILSEAGTLTNNWDTHTAAPGGYFISNCSDIHYINNKIYGGMRFFDDWAKGGPFRAINCFAVNACNNYHNGLTVGYGYVTVSNGSVTVVGTGTSFSTLTSTFTNSDVDNQILIEGDTIVRKISVITDPTHITLATAYAGAGTNVLKRYWIATSGDLLGASPVFDSVIANNILEYSGDEGLSIGSQGGPSSMTNNIFTGNKVAYCRVNGCVIFGGAKFNIFSNNVFHNNHQGAVINAVVDRGAIGILPGPGVGDTVAVNSFIGNIFIDDQSVPTQLYAYDIDDSALAFISLNSLRDGVKFQTGYHNPELSTPQFNLCFNLATDSQP